MLTTLLRVFARPMQEFANRVFVTVYMGTVNSSQETNVRQGLLHD